MLLNFYPISSPQKLESYCKVYLPLVLQVASTFGLDLTSQEFTGDHLGLQVLSSEEFDEANKLLLTYSTLVNAGVIHNRRNNIYKFNSPITCAGLTIKGIEIFEPKPTADVNKLKPGIEHIAFKVADFETFSQKLSKSSAPIDKTGTDDEGNMFLKTKLVNMIELEFRSNFLGEQK